MVRHYYRSPLGTFFRWWAGTALLVLFFVFIQWFALQVLPAIVPYLIAGAVGWVLAWLFFRARR